MRKLFGINGRGVHASELVTAFYLDTFPPSDTSCSTNEKSMYELPKQRTNERREKKTAFKSRDRLNDLLLFDYFEHLYTHSSFSLGQTSECEIHSHRHRGMGKKLYKNNVFVSFVCLFVVVGFPTVFYAQCFFSPELYISD